MNRMKKVLSLVLVSLMVISLSVSGFASETQKTSEDYRFEERFIKAKLLFSDFSVLADNHFPIPGLENTDVAGDSCNCMTPQGLCVTQDYILISAYCNVNKYKTELEEYINYSDNAQKLKNEENHEKHNSVIYIIDKNTGEYIKNMVLPDTNHVGGLCYDGKNIYIAKSTDAEVSVITSKQLDKIIATKSLSVNAEYEYTVPCGSTASFVTYFDGLLWVGVFNENDNGELNGFTVNKDGFTLTEVASVEIPEKANGACFTEIDGDVCLAVNSSYGRKNPSDIYLYSVSDYGTTEMTLNKKGSYLVPPTVQNSCVYAGKVYYMFESAATCYSCVDAPLGIKATTCAVDRVCITDENKLFNWHSDEIFLFQKIVNFFNNIMNLIKTVFPCI